FVERHLGDVGAHHIEYEGTDLGVRILQAIEGVEDLILADQVLDGDGHLDEDVVLGLGLDVDIQLLQAQIDPASDLLDQRDLEVEARAIDAGKLTEALHNDGGLLLHRKNSAGDEDQQY